MKELLLTGYVLVWPVMAAIVLAVLCAGFAKDVLDAKREGKSVV